MTQTLEHPQESREAGRQAWEAHLSPRFRSNAEHHESPTYLRSQFHRRRDGKVVWAQRLSGKLDTRQLQRSYLRGLTGNQGDWLIVWPVEAANVVPARMFPRLFTPSPDDEGLTITSVVIL